VALPSSFNVVGLAVKRTTAGSRMVLTIESDQLTPVPAGVSIPEWRPVNFHGWKWGRGRPQCSGITVVGLTPVPLLGGAASLFGRGVDSGLAFSPPRPAGATLPGTPSRVR
jgi:hypothetical protein